MHRRVCCVYLNGSEIAQGRTDVMIQTIKLEGSRARLSGEPDGMT